MVFWEIYELTFIFAGGVEPLGTKITLKLTDPTDLSRDVLKVKDLTKLYSVLI